MSKTYREQFDEALACKDQGEAVSWLSAEMIRYQQEFGKDADEAKQIILQNIGYMAGYCDRDVARKIYELFGAAHPIFGTAAIEGTLTPESALQAGKRKATETR